MLRQLRSFLPENNPATLLLIGLVVGLFVVMSLDGVEHFTGGGLDVLLRPPAELMLRWGVHIRGDFEWWRIIMSVLVHFGLVHLLFNIYALWLVGPKVEDWYGSALGFGLFVLIGVGSAVASNQLSSTGIAAGASGGLMGLIGLMVVAGHRHRSSLGLALRNMMLRWAAFVMFLGLVISATGQGIDNIAHGAGLVLGLLFGWLLPPPPLRVSQGVWWRMGLLVAMVAVIAAGFYGMARNQLGIRALDRCRAAISEDAKNAEGECTEVLRQAPKEPEIYDLLAALYLRQGQVDAAKQIFATAEENLVGRRRYELGVLAFDRCVDFIRPIEEALRSAHVEGPLSPELLLYCEQSVVLMPEVPEAYHNLAQAYRLHGRFAEAEAVCVKARNAFSEDDLTSRASGCRP